MSEYVTTEGRTYELHTIQALHIREGDRVFHNGTIKRVAWECRSEVLVEVTFTNTQVVEFARHAPVETVGRYVGPASTFERMTPSHIRKA